MLGSGFSSYLLRFGPVTPPNNSTFQVPNNEKAILVGGQGLAVKKVKKRSSEEIAMVQVFFFYFFVLY